MKTNIDDVGGASNGDGLRLPVTLRAAGAEGADRTSAFVAHLGAAAAGSVLVRNEGGYVARFTLTYSLDGHEFTQESGDITLGVNKSAWIPAGATEIQLKVEENIGSRVGGGCFFVKRSNFGTRDFSHSSHRSSCVTHRLSYGTYSVSVL